MGDSNTQTVLEHILINTYNADQTLRSQAEDALSQYLCKHGSLYHMTIFLGNPQIHRDLRQAAGIAVKNRIKKFWSEDDTIKEDEKELVRQSILHILISENDNSIRRILSDIVYNIFQNDYVKGNWPNFLPTVLSTITSQDSLKIYNALVALRKAVKYFEFKQRDARAGLNDIVQTSFPILQSLIASLVDNNQMEAAQVMRLCLKIFYSSTCYALPQVQGIDVNFWFNSFAQLLQKKLPEASEGLEPAGQPTTIEERTSWPWWKLKKWAARIVCQFIQRYGNPRSAGEENKNFALYFRSNLAPLLLGPIMNNLAIKASGGFLTDNLHRMCLAYMMSSVELSPTYKIIKPHLDFVLFQAIFPTLCLSPDDIEMFTEDPVEFVRKIHDPMEDWLDPRQSAENLLQTLARYRAKDVLPKLLPYLQAILQTYTDAPMESKNFVAKDGVMVAFATITKILMDLDEYKDLIEPFVRNHVVPEFVSVAPFLRYRACWMVEYFDHEDWKMDDTVPVLLQGLLQGLRDPAIPVQAAAACSMRELIATDGAVDLLRPYLHQIVSEYFRIMNEVENEAILGALQGIVESFGDDIDPIAGMMVSHLVEKFDSFTSQCQGDADDDEAAFNASQCLDTIICILDAIQGRDDTLLQVEAIIIPLLIRITDKGDDSFEYLDSVIQILSVLMYSDAPISPGIFSLCGPLLSTLDSYAFDYISDMTEILLTYMKKDMYSFLHGVIPRDNNIPFPTVLLNVIQKHFQEDTSEYELDCKSAASLLTCFIYLSKPLAAISSQVGDLLRIILLRLEKTKTTSLRHKLLEGVMALIYYDPQLFVSILSTNDAVGALLFNTLFDNVKVMENTFSQKLIVLSFTSLLSLDVATIPDYIKANLSGMYKQVIGELTLLKEDEDNNVESGGGDNENNDYDDDGDADHSKVMNSKFGRYSVPVNGYDEDEDCINAEDEEYLDLIRNSSTMENKVNQFLAGEPGDDEEEDDLCNTEWILKDIDTRKYFFDSMRATATRDPAFMQMLNSHLTEEDKNLLNHLANS